MKTEDSLNLSASYLLNIRPMEISGNIVNVLNGSVFPGTILWNNGIITQIIRAQGPFNQFIIPGFIDAHVHIESSLLIPSEFARIAVTHGTIATLSDPHEIANVLGIKGVDFMIGNGNSVPLKFFFGASPCVPATPFETSGASLGTREVKGLLEREDIRYLSEVMNFPGVLAGDPEIMDKIAAARALGRRIDGHAPGLRGTDLDRYIRAGISTDHECLTLDEAQEKIGKGMKVFIREGSAARGFDDFAPLIKDFPGDLMFCSDDIHADSLIAGHMNLLVKRAVAMGLDVMKVLQVACVNPVLHYGLEVGLLREGDHADFLVVDNLTDFTVLQTFVGGEMVAEKGKALFSRVTSQGVNHFRTRRKLASDFSVPAEGTEMRVMEAFDGQLFTDMDTAPPLVRDGCAVSDRERDILKIAVVNRYQDSPPAVAFVRGFGLKSGAMASSVAHDSHNIVVVGVEDRDICRAVNLVVKQGGAMAMVLGEEEEILPLPVAGIMSDQDAFAVAENLKRLDLLAKRAGSGLSDPFMTLSFMALLVIPRLKLSDKGLFDGDAFNFTNLFSCS